MTRFIALICLVLTLVRADGMNQRVDDPPTTYIQETVEGDKIAFVILGDFGGFPKPIYTTKIQRRVAELVGKDAERMGAKFALALGDNFYFTGVRDIYDDRFQRTYEDTYSAESLFIPWYPTMGNHDWMGNAQAEIDYTGVSSRWTYPWYWYTVDYILNSGPDTSRKLRIIFFDTTIPCGIGSSPQNGPLDWQMADEQWAWFERQLQEGQDADYIMVVSHYPIFSAGNGGPHLECLLPLRDLLNFYKVNIFIAGHDHSLQHLTEPDCNTDELNYCLQYSIVGCSNFVGQRLANRDSDEFNVHYAKGTFRYWFRGCYATAEATENELNIYYHEGRQGSVVHTVTAYPRDLTEL